MKHIVWRPYWDYQKEERWLNQMMAKGYALTDYSWCRYVFEEAKPGAYVYKLDLLKQWPTAPESRAYLRFLEDSGVEVVATYMKWVYLRQPAEMGAFELYTDKASLIAHYKTILSFWGVLTALEIGIGLMNILISLPIHTATDGQNGWLNFTAGLIPLGIGLAFIKMLLPTYRRMRQLQRDINITE